MAEWSYVPKGFADIYEGADEQVPHDILDTFLIKESDTAIGSTLVNNASIQSALSTRVPSSKMDFRA